MVTTMRFPEKILFFPDFKLGYCPSLFMAFPTNIQMCKKYIQIVIHVCHAVVLRLNAYHNYK